MSLRRDSNFACAVRAFFDPLRIVVQDPPRDHGEDRCRLFDVIDGRACVVVCAVRVSVVRIISVRKANPKEVAEHEHNAHQD